MESPKSEQFLKKVGSYEYSYVNKGLRRKKTDAFKKVKPWSGFELKIFLFRKKNAEPESKQHKDKADESCSV